MKDDQNKSQNKKQEEVEKLENEEPQKDNKEVNELLKKAEEAENKYKRALADYQNLEKRVRDEKSEWIKMANRELLLRMLPVLDTLQLAKQHSEDKALSVTVQQFLDVLRQEGIEKIETERKQFDPHLMEAISTMAGDENKVLQEVRAGYKIGDRVLRVAQVIVGSAKQNEKEKK